MKTHCWNIGLLAVLLAVMSGCVVQETTPRGPVEAVDQKKLLEQHIDLGFRYIGRKNLEKARFHLNKALKLNANSSEANTGFALVYNLEGEYALTDQYFLRALKPSGKHTRTRFYYAAFLNEQMRYSDARRQLLKVTSDVDFKNRSLAFFTLGQVELKLGNQAASRAAFEKSLRLNGNFAQAYLEVADLEYIDGNYQNSFNYLSNYRRLVRSPSAKSLWLGVRLEHHRNNRDGEDSYGLALEKMFPDSKENRAYQQWRKNRS